MSLRRDSSGTVPPTEVQWGGWPAYLELSKARLSALVVLTAAAGFVLASDATPQWGRLTWTALGTAFSAFGVNALNQWLERRRDGLMVRTRERPLPARRVGEVHALLWGLGMSAAGLLVLVAAVNGLAASLALTAELIYIGLYTPLKTRTSLCTLVGAVCGAIPPMIGWSAAVGSLGTGAWILGALLFAWQIPHFLSLAWLYRDDYARGGFKMLPVFDPSGQTTCRMVVLYSLALLAIGPGAMLTGLTGWVQGIGSVVLGTGLLLVGVRLYRERTREDARRVFLASLVYLPALLGLMIADRSPLFERVVILASLDR